MSKSMRSDLKGQMFEIRRLQRQGRVKKLMGLLNGWLQQRYLELEHPYIDGVVTRCVRSEICLDANILYFSDESREHCWAAVQVFNCIDYIFCYNRDQVESISSQQFGRRKFAQIKAQIRAVDVASISRGAPFKGVLISHSRPAHFFYDQAINLHSLDITPDKQVAHFDKVYFNIEALVKPGVKVVQLEKLDGVYCYPIGVTGESSSANAMQRAIYNYAQDTPLTKSYDFVLWIGVAGEKRRLINQINVYYGLAKKLAKSYQSIAFVVDGFTAFDNERITNETDDTLLRELQEKCRHLANVTIYSVIGQDYYTKVCYAKQCSAFVTYAGTQLMVPLKFCNLPGVIHSNHSYRLAGDIKAQKNVKYIAPECVEEVVESNVNKPDYLSYRIKWQDVYRTLAEVAH